MMDSTEIINWQAMARPHGEAERALGRLGEALARTPLHATWLWREISRASVIIAQTSGDIVDVDQLRKALIGVPVDRAVNTTGLARAKRIFLAAAPLFRSSPLTDSNTDLWPRFWGPGASEDADHATDDQNAMESAGGAGELERRQLLSLVRDLAGFADDGQRPALINLLVDLRQHAATKRLPAHLIRLALPLALNEAKLVPKSAPGLLGGRRLPLGMSAASPEARPLTDWLKLGLGELSKEADQSHRRLVELTRQHQAWHRALATARLRRHARTPAALDLLAATPVLNIGLVARHLDCSHVAAGQIVARLVDLGILIAATSRSRHKIYLAGDLATPARGGVDIDVPLSSSDPAPLVDVDAVGATLDGLLADLERLNERARNRVRQGG